MNRVASKKKHIGRNISLIRESREMTQEELATRIGTSQQMISKHEQSEELDEKVLEKIAKGLGVETDYLHAFNPDSKARISNTFNGEVSGGQNGSSITAETITFNPVSELVASYKDQIKNMEAMYERIIAEKEKQIDELKGKK